MLAIRTIPPLQECSRSITISHQRNIEVSAAYPKRKGEKDMIKKERDCGKTIIITTHNMQDATELCDRVVFIVDGQMKALDTPHNFIMQRGAAKVNYTYMENGREEKRTSLLSKISEDDVLGKLLSENRVTSIHSLEPTLSDIFIEITGAQLD